MLKNLLSFIAGKDADPKASSPIVDGKINYTFQCGLRAYQEELNLHQTEKLTAVMLELDFSDIVNKSLQDFILMLTNGKVITKILDIILIGVPENDLIKDVDYSALKNSELQAVFGDFFSLNPTAIGWLKNIVQGLTSIPQTPST